MTKSCFYIRLLLALSLISFVQFSFAVDYHWKHTSLPGEYSSPRLAAQAYIDDVASRATGYSGHVIGNTRFQGDTKFEFCFVYKFDSTGKYQNSCWHSVSRFGDSCPPNTTLNPSTKECESPPSSCESKSGESTTWSLLRPDLNGLGNIEYACMDNCRLALGTSQCAPVSEGATTGVCWGVGTFNGAECQPSDSPTGGTPPTDPTEPTDPTDPTDPPPECGPGYSWSGTTCVKDEPKECDPSTGEVCPPPDKPCDPATETCPPDEGDGDGEGEGDGDGGDGDGDGSGEGDGEGDGSGEGDGDGEGEGDGDEPGECDPKTDPNQCKKPSVAGESCETELKCEGDVIQCAILRKNKEQLCQWKYDAPVKAQIETALSGPDYELEEKSTAVGSLFTNAVNKGRWLPSNCPSPENVTVMGRSYTISWEPLCRFATAIGPLIVMLASIFFAVSIGRALKGS